MHSGYDTDSHNAGVYLPLFVWQFLAHPDESSPEAAAGSPRVRPRPQVRTSRHQVLEPSHRQPPSNEGISRLHPHFTLTPAALGYICRRENVVRAHSFNIRALINLSFDFCPLVLDKKRHLWAPRENVAASFVFVLLQNLYLPAFLWFTRCLRLPCFFPPLTACRFRPGSTTE